MKRTLLLGLSLALAAAVSAANQITVDTAKVKYPTAPDLWGIFFEDIDLSLDGGVYAELVRNRSFEDGAGDLKHALNYWRALAGAQLSLDTAKPLSAKNRHAMKIVAGPGGAFANDGYFGMHAKAGVDYKLSVAVRGKAAQVKVALERADGTAVTTVGTFAVSGDEWTTKTLTLTGIAIDKESKLVFRLPHGGDLVIDCVTLMPSDTYGTSGIFRKELMEKLAALKPSFVRFPGGCWVEGDTMDKAYRWKKTIGSIWERPTQWNIWGYWATHGVGFHEYLLICEELGAKPLFCINVGMSHREVVPMEKMGEFVQDALDCIEYANGPVTSKWGAKRAAAGHPKPFNLEYLEIGNENGGPKYEERYDLIAKAVRAKYPNVKLVFDRWGSTKSVKGPKELRDDHFYMTPDWFMDNAYRYADPRQREGAGKDFGVFVGEYAVTSHVTKYGTLRAAIGEAAFMAGLEDCADVVKLAAYAPLFANVKHQRWSPNLIYVAAGGSFVNPSFDVQRLFSENRGAQVLATTVDCEPRVNVQKLPCVGVGAFAGQAAFRNLKVCDAAGRTVYANAFAKPEDLKTGKLFGAGKWEIVDGALVQTAKEQPFAATTVTFPIDQKDVTITLQAKRVSGPEGFLVVTGKPLTAGGEWINFGGWGNRDHGVEMQGFAGGRVRGKIAEGKWYDVKVQVKDGAVTVWLDGKCVINPRVTGAKALIANAVTSADGREVIVKVVNCSSRAVTSAVTLANGTFADRAKMTVFTGESAGAANSLENPNALVPVTTCVPVIGNALNRTFPAYSLTIFRIPRDRRR